MDCRTNVPGMKRAAIQICEDHLRAQKESVVSELEAAVLKALMSGVELENLEIIERTVWTSKSKRKAHYTVTAKDKRV